VELVSASSLCGELPLTQKEVLERSIFMTARNKESYRRDYHDDVDSLRRINCYLPTNHTNT